MTTYTDTVLSALSDPTRRAVLELVADRPRPVGELADALPVSRPAVSQHLKVLLDAGLLEATREGTRHVYVLRPTGLQKLAAYLQRFWTMSLRSFKRAAELAEKEAMTSKLTEASVKVAVTVAASQDTAFRTFTEDMAAWWPEKHHIIEGTLDHMVFEARAGGDVYDIATDGSRCRWARVLAYDPPERIVLSWDISLEWQLETDLERTSEIEVRFEKLDASTTLVELEHRNLDRHGEGWEAMRDTIAQPEGCGDTLRRFAAHVAAAASTTG